MSFDILVVQICYSAYKMFGWVINILVHVQNVWLGIKVVIPRTSVCVSNAVIPCIDIWMAGNVFSSGTQCLGGCLSCCSTHTILCGHPCRYTVCTHFVFRIACGCLNLLPIRMYTDFVHYLPQTPLLQFAIQCYLALYRELIHLMYYYYYDI